MLLIDGGRGQLNAALAAFAELQITPPTILPLAKREEEIYLPHRAEPLRLSRHAYALRLLQYVRTRPTASPSTIIIFCGENPRWASSRGRSLPSGIYHRHIYHKSISRHMTVGAGASACPEPHGRAQRATADAAVRTGVTSTPRSSLARTSGNG